MFQVHIIKFKVQTSMFKDKRASLASQKGVNSHGINALLNL